MKIWFAIYFLRLIVFLILQLRPFSHTFLHLTILSKTFKILKKLNLFVLRELIPHLVPPIAQKGMY